jgi:hypothetical protein
MVGLAIIILYQQVSKQIDLINERVSKARDLYLSDKLDEDDYREIKLLISRPNLKML